MRLDRVYAQSGVSPSSAKPANLAGKNHDNEFATSLEQAHRQLAGSAPTVRPPPVHDGPLNDEDVKWLLPSREGVALHGEYVRQLLADAMTRAGLPMNPSVQIASVEDGKVTLSGKRADLARIEQLCNQNQELNSAICNLHVIAAGVPAMDEFGDYIRDWYRASNDAERMAVYLHYTSSMPAPSKVEISLSGSAVSVSVNGEAMPQMQA
ncbi:hypothetical protein [Chromobacterium vaccinii]|uniref:hypothetical protein n=1 Tax=Chromobacterium vaccinii TaxID=1108595 RepID=UPI000617C102|nr:hypothetical protein [Chromobacterium vaccinii]